MEKFVPAPSALLRQSRADRADGADGQDGSQRIWRYLFWAGKNKLHHDLYLSYKRVKINAERAD